MLGARAVLALGSAVLACGVCGACGAREPSAANAGDPRVTALAGESTVTLAPRAGEQGSAGAGANEADPPAEPDRPVGISVGYGAACALGARGTVWCRGHGFLGDGVETTGFRHELVAIPALKGALEIAFGEEHACARFGDGTVRCWGGNSFGQVGDGTKESRASPTRVNGLGEVAAVAAGGMYSCALQKPASGGKLLCWGFGGDIVTGESTTPRAVPGLAGIAGVAIGNQHACALGRDGGVSCWGNRDYGMLGDGQTATTTGTPARVPGVAGVRAIALGRYHSCVLLDGDGSVRCWGANGMGELGDGTSATPRLVPGAVKGLRGAVAIAAGGGSHTCALLRDRTVRCWGSGLTGELGYGGSDERREPTAVRALADVAALSVGVVSTAALTADGRLFYWGWDGAGPGDKALSDDKLAPIALVFGARP